MSRIYHHLSPEERAVVMIEQQNGSSVRAMARRLQRAGRCHPRERATGCGGCAAAASLLTKGGALHQYAHDRLVFDRGSPQQITARLRHMPGPERPGLISHATIYASLCAQPRGALKQDMVAALRQGEHKRGTRRTTMPPKASCPMHYG